MISLKSTSKAPYFTISIIVNKPFTKISFVTTLPSSKPRLSSSLLPSLLYLSQQPSVSTNPSISLTPSQMPTWSPIVSKNRTASTTQEVDFIGIDEYSRRYCPYFPVTTTNKSYSYQQVLNCVFTAADTNPGCILIPR